MSVDTSSYTVQYKSGSSWVTIPAGQVERVSVSSPAAGGDNPLTFGDDARAEAKISLRNDAITDLARDTSFRVKFARASTDVYAHYGGLYSLDRTLGTVQVATKGYADRISRTKAYTPAFYRRPIATKTTSSSIEDPTNASYRGGLINYLLWQAGGRPAAQDSTYTTALFYYTCDQALLAPTWSWTAGDDAYAACLELAKAGGGQLFQDETGIVTYHNPLWFAGATPSFTFGPGDYASDISYSIRPESVANAYLCQYMGRAARPIQEVYNDQPFLTLAVGETQALDLDLTHPVSTLETNGGGGNTLLTSALNVAYLDGAIVPQSSTAGYVHNVVVAAQRVTLTIGNYSNRPFKIYRVTLRGTPIVATEGGSVRYGTGTTKNIPQNVFIQSRTQAARIAQLYGLYAGTARRVFSFTAAFDPAKLVGQRGALTVSQWSLSSLPVVIIDRQIDETGQLCKYRVVDVSNVPVASDLFLIGSNNYAGLTKKIGV